MTLQTKPINNNIFFMQMEHPFFQRNFDALISCDELLTRDAEVCVTRQAISSVSCEVRLRDAIEWRLYTHFPLSLFLMKKIAYTMKKWYFYWYHNFPGCCNLLVYNQIALARRTVILLMVIVSKIFSLLRQPPKSPEGGLKNMWRCWLRKSPSGGFRGLLTWKINFFIFIF
jgi:hypothetical protein